MNAFVMPHRSMKFYQVIAAGFRLWQQAFRRIILLGILFAVGSALPSYVVMFFQAHGITAVHPSLLFLASLLLLLFERVIEAASYAQLHAIGVLKRPLPFFKALLVGLKKLFYIIVAIILFTLLAMVTTVVIILPFWLAGHYWQPEHVNVLDMLALIWVAIAYFYLLVSLLIFFIPLIVVDNLGPYAALKKSYHLTKQGWMQTAFILLLLILIFILPEFFIALIHFPVIKAIATLVWTSLFFPFSFAVLLTQMVQLKARAKQHHS